MEVNKLPVMQACCKTCPFKPDADGRFQNMELATAIIKRTLFKSQQICHGTEDKNREPRNRCFGSFEYNAEIYERMGLDKEAFRDGKIKIKYKSQNNENRI